MLKYELNKAKVIQILNKIKNIDDKILSLLNKINDIILINDFKTDTKLIGKLKCHQMDIHFKYFILSNKDIQLFDDKIQLFNVSNDILKMNNYTSILIISINQSYKHIKDIYIEINDNLTKELIDNILTKELN